MVENSPNTKQTNILTRLALGASGTLIVNTASTGLYFLISLFLARFLKASGFGAYTYAISLIRLLMVFSMIGLDTLLVREISAYKKLSKWSLMKGLIKWSNLMVFFVATVLAILTAFIFFIFSAHFEDKQIITLWISLVILPIIAIVYCKQSILIGYNVIVIGQIPASLLRPSFFLVFIFLGYLIFNANLSAIKTMMMYVLATGMTLIVTSKLLIKTMPDFLKDVKPQYERRMWLSSAWPLLLVGGMNIINSQTDILMLGTLMGSTEAGIYVSATKGAELTIFVHLAVNRALGPLVASLYAENSISKLQNLITKGTRITFFASLPIGIALILFGSWFLGFFGQEFIRGKEALSILCFSRLIDAGMGPVNILLIMTGFERFAALALSISAVLNILLNATLIPVFGINGAAWATATCIILYGFIQVSMVRTKLGIKPTILGR